jgi:hypothetical protein
MTTTEIYALNLGLQGKRIRPAGIDEHGMLWVRPTGHGETPDDLDMAMDQADKYLASKGYARDSSEPIFRQYLAWGQRLIAIGGAR